MDTEVLVLGAGQEVGRSCVLLSCNEVNIMFDCGLHMGKKGNERLPLLSVLGEEMDINSQVHLVFITHFHLDHIGALPYLTEVLGYRGPVIMTHATKAIAPLILEDYHNICQTRCGHSGFRSSTANCGMTPVTEPTV
jgi:integrator complex subunit 11